MNCTVKKSGSYPTATWAGGSTTELFLYPQDSSYAERNFQFRVSTSTVEEESAQFTDLPGFRRLIMPLDGEMRLVHETHYDQNLEPFQVDIFDGGWHTRSFGRCRDFNVIHAEGWSTSMQALQAPDAYLCPRDGYTIFYVLEDGVKVTVNSGEDSISHRLDKGDLLVVENGPDESASAVFAGPSNAFAVMAVATHQ